jgi:flagellum-specific peptidoglycan hydrolase FlgJ
LVLLSQNVTSELVNTQKYTLSEYIGQFKITAIEEMNRTGVPASITMAQAILESAYGNSMLATNANNHFGLKCKPDWTGETYSIGDACYKKYNTVLDSYADHSNHIKSRKWYADLFKLKITDYKGWSYGLKKDGYAQDPNYAYNLISIIERYKFNKMDSLYTPPADTSATKK